MIAFPETQFHSEDSNIGASVDGVYSAALATAGPLQAAPDRNEFSSFHDGRPGRPASEVWVPAIHESDY